MNGYALAYLLLVINQLMAGGTFLAMYLSSGWPSTPVGKHLAFWVAATCAVDLSWLLLLAVHWGWLVWALLAAQLLVGLIGWQRVILIWRSRHDQG